jgi:hypothetical protein
MIADSSADFTSRALMGDAGQWNRSDFVFDEVQ